MAELLSPINSLIQRLDLNNERKIIKENQVLDSLSLEELRGRERVERMDLEMEGGMVKISKWAAVGLVAINILQVPFDGQVGGHAVGALAAAGVSLLVMKGISLSMKYRERVLGQISSRISERIEGS